MLFKSQKYTYLTCALFLTGCASSSTIDIKNVPKPRQISYAMSSGINNYEIAREITNAMARASKVKQLPGVKGVSYKVLINGQQSSFKCDLNVCDLEFSFHNGEATGSMGAITSEQTVSGKLIIIQEGMNKNLSISIDNEVKQSERTSPLAHTYPLLLSEEEVRALPNKMMSFSAPALSVKKPKNGMIETNNSIPVVKANFQRFADVRNLHESRESRISMQKLGGAMPGQDIRLTLYQSSKGAVLEYEYDDIYIIEANKKPYLRNGEISGKVEKRLRDIMSK